MTVISKLHWPVSLFHSYREQTCCVFWHHCTQRFLKGEKASTHHRDNNEQQNHFHWVSFSSFSRRQRGRKYRTDGIYSHTGDVCTGHKKLYFYWETLEMASVAVALVQGSTLSITHSPPTLPAEHPLFFYSTRLSFHCSHSWAASLPVSTGGTPPRNIYSTNFTQKCASLSAGGSDGQLFLCWSDVTAELKYRMLMRWNKRCCHCMSLSLRTHVERCLTETNENFLWSFNNRTVCCHFN